MEYLVEHIQNAILQAIKKATKETMAQMINEMGIDNALDKIQSYPIRIKTQQLALTHAQRQLDEVKMELETVKADIMIEINAATGENGKPLFSNEKTRDAEFIRRTKISPEYQQVLAEYRNIEDSFNEIKFTLDQFYNEFSTQKAVLSAMTAKTNLLAGIQKI